MMLTYLNNIIYKWLYRNIVFIWVKKKLDWFFLEIRVIGIIIMLFCRQLTDIYSFSRTFNWHLNYTGRCLSSLCCINNPSSGSTFGFFSENIRQTGILYVMKTVLAGLLSCETQWALATLETLCLKLGV